MSSSTKTTASARDYTIVHPDNTLERFEATTRLLDIAEQLGDPVMASRALGLRFKVAMELADIAEAERCVTKNCGLVAHLGQPVLAWATVHHEATLHVLRADPDADAAATAARELGEVTIGQPDIQFLSAGHWRTLDWNRGRLGDHEDFIRQASQQLGSLFPVMTAGYALILLETDQTEAAASIFDELAATGFAHPTNNVGWLMFMTECAWVCSRLERADCVPRLRAMLEPYPEQFAVGGFGAWVVGPVAFHLGLLATTVGDWDAADAYFNDAASTHERIGAPTWLARTRLEWARTLLIRAEPGDAERAQGLLRQALETTRALDLPPIERDASRLLSGV